MIATSTWVALALAAAAAGTQYYNTERTAKRQDSALATQIRNQGKRQSEADAKVAGQVEAMKGSTAEASRRKALDDYTGALQSRKARIESGLTPAIGSDAFKADATQAANDSFAYGTENAGLLSRIDAAGDQRRSEGFGFSNLASDLNLIGRDARGQNFLDELRLRAIRRNAGLDAAASLMSGASGAMMSGASGGGGAGSGMYDMGYRGLSSVGK
jgi:hypothetical protein